jgi:hypothetical protein
MENVARRPPYGAIALALRSGKAIPFLGSGASRSQLADTNWEYGMRDALPEPGDLAAHLADLGEYKPRDPEEMHDLPRAAQYFDLASGRGLLRDVLDEIFTAEPQLGDHHEYLAEIETPEGVPYVLITTNYDDLLERAFDANGRDYLLVVHTTDLPDKGEQLLVREPDGDFTEMDASLIVPSKKSSTIIYKMHGSVRREKGAQGQYVITDDDYVNFLSRMTRAAAIPAILNQPLKMRSFLFLGYGLEDWNLRVLLSQLASRRFGESPASDSEIAPAPQPTPDDRTNWAIQSGPSVFDSFYWGKKGVDVYDMTIEEFVAELRERS